LKWVAQKGVCGPVTIGRKKQKNKTEDAIDELDASTFIALTAHSHRVMSQQKAHIILRGFRQIGDSLTEPGFVPKSRPRLTNAPIRQTRAFGLRG
jgi:hypothetical protein